MGYSFLSLRLDECILEKDGLYAKRGRWERFKTAAQRNSWLKTEIDSLKNQINAQNNQIKVLSQEILKSKNLSGNLNADISLITEKIDRSHSDFEIVSRQFEEARQLRNRLDEKRKYV